MFQSWNSTGRGYQADLVLHVPSLSGNIEIHTLLAIESDAGHECQECGENEKVTGTDRLSLAAHVVSGNLFTETHIQKMNTVGVREMETRAAEAM